MLSINPLSFSFFFFALLSFFQSFFLSLCLTNLLNLCKKNSILYPLLGLLSFFFLTYYVEFILVGLMDTTLSFAAKIFFVGGWTEFFVNIRALNLATFMKILISIALMLIPLLSILLYKFTETWSQKHPLNLQKKLVLFLFLTSFSALLLLDASSTKIFSPFLWNSYAKKLPFTTCFFSLQKSLSSSLPDHLKIPKDKKALSFLLQNTFSKPLSEKPNIVLFIAETIRNDCMTEEITPNLFDFKNQSISFQHSLSNSNATPISWFSIFYSQFPHFWHHYRKNLQEGSFALKILQRLGYSIHVFSSAELSYFHMDQCIFGNLKNISFHDFFTSDPTLSPSRDRRTLDAVKNFLDHSSEKTGQLIIVFLDSTHSEYTWEKSFTPIFTPYAKQLNYLGISHSITPIQPIKNRYLNALHYIDSLMGDFFSFLKNQNLWDSSLLVFTGDHGEEFFEEGALFHGTHLNHYQTEVPIYYKLPLNLQSRFSPTTNISCHLDIFPSILHLLTEQEDLFLFDGRSIFSENRWPYVFTVQANGKKKPREFFLHNGKEKIFGFFHKGHYQLTSIKNENSNEEELSSERVNVFDPPAPQFK
jgi:hypothetical protein